MHPKFTVLAVGDGRARVRFDEATQNTPDIAGREFMFKAADCLRVGVQYVAQFRFRRGSMHLIGAREVVA